MRRYFVLIRREQVDEMVDSTNNVLHEFCCFESDSDHAECLGSIVLEEVVKFETGVYAGLPEHEKAAQMLWRAKNPKPKKNNDTGNSRRTVFSNLSDLFPVRFDTTDYEDYTIELSLPHRIMRLRYVLGCLIWALKFSLLALIFFSPCLVVLHFSLGFVGLLVVQCGDQIHI